MAIPHPHSLYIHIPFCSSICPYCDFTKLLYQDGWAFSYLEALKKELEFRCKDHTYDTVYIGGGTPSVLPLDLFKRLLEMVDPYVAIGAEYTLEANPESLTEDKIALLPTYRINRISMGMQSSSKKVLDAMGRRHTVKDIEDRIQALHQVGIVNISIDLIYALPNESKAELLKDLEVLTNLDITHCSCYSYIQERDSIWSKQGVVEADDEIQAEQFDLVEAILTAHGFLHYEVSSYTKPGYESRHNKAYWKDERYVAVGLGASGYIDNIRYKNVTSLPRYLKGDYTENEEIVSLKDDKTYFLLTNLRLAEGFAFATYAERFQEDIRGNKAKELKEAQSRGYIRLTSERILVTSLGLKMLDSLILMLMD